MIWAGFSDSLIMVDFYLVSIYVNARNDKLAPGEVVKRNTVLWVDDDILFLSHLNLMLEKTKDSLAMESVEGIDFIFVKDSQSAIERLKEDASCEEPKIGLIILDQNMPDMSGINLARSIRSHPDLNHYRFAMCSADANSGHYEKSINEGSMMFLTKGMGEEAMLITILHLIQYVNHHENIIHKSRRKIRRSIAAGLIAAHENKKVEVVMSSLNDRVQKHHSDMSLEQFTESYIEHHDGFVDSINEFKSKFKTQE